jgi:AmmeMemoRadiSam system protein B
MGTVRTAVSFLERLEDRCGNLRTYELDHAREHSIELQVAWLQHLFGSDTFEMVPVLCPDPCGPTGTLPVDGQGVDLREFASILGELLADDPQDTLVVAGADLSHVGAAFGDERRLDDAFLEEVRQRDHRALDELQINDPSAFLERVAEQDNATRICSAGCLYVLAAALPDTTGTVLRYHQAVDQASQTCVTCTAVAFT